MQRISEFWRLFFLLFSPSFALYQQLLLELYLQVPETIQNVSFISTRLQSQDTSHIPTPVDCLTHRLVSLGMVWCQSVVGLSLTSVLRNFTKLNTWNWCASTQKSLTSLLFWLKSLKEINAFFFHVTIQRCRTPSASSLNFTRLANFRVCTLPQLSFC